MSPTTSRIKDDAESSRLMGELKTLRLPKGIIEANLHQSYKNCFFGSVSSQTYGNVCGGENFTQNLVFQYPCYIC